MPLVVLGESGAGKSALLANWVRRSRAAEAGATEREAPLILEHYVGATPASADWAAMCRRLIEELSRHFELKLEVPGAPDELRLAFANCLHRAAVLGRVVLVLDGLNRLEDRDQALELGYVPTSAVVIGAGAVGLEFASFYRSMGAEVTVIEALPALAPLEDVDISKEVARAFRKRGIDGFAGAKVQDVKDAGDHVEVTYDAGKGAVTVNADICLVAVGRGPISDGLGYTLFVGEKPAELPDLGWMSGTRATLRNTGHVPNTSAAPQAPSDPDPAKADAEAAKMLLFVGGFSSAHVGGVQIGLGDASVRFVSDEIDSSLWQQLGNRSDGKLLNLSEVD